MRVLLIDDSAGDVRLTLEAFRTAKNACLSKPVQLEAFESIVRSIRDFGLTQTQLTHEPAR